jgi:hypothetical protein
MSTESIPQAGEIWFYAKDNMMFGRCPHGVGWAIMPFDNAKSCLTPCQENPPRVCGLKEVPYIQSLIFNAWKYASGAVKLSTEQKS